MNTVWVLPIEGHEQRYTSQWLKHLPAQLEQAAAARNVKVRIKSLVGDMPDPRPLNGRFLDFAGTNFFKGTQLAQVARRFSNDEVRDGDTFLVADAWNPAVANIRYMKALEKKNVRIVGLWHAGHYDPNDFLGKVKAEERAWLRSMERTLFEAYDISGFATQYHIDLFRKGLGVPESDKRVVQVGWPMEYLEGELQPYLRDHKDKENIVLFPHRIAPEKQVELFQTLSAEIGSTNGYQHWQFVVAQQGQGLTKAEYHDLLGRSRVVFSASLQETLGIGCYEGVLAGAVPMVPNRLSYVEMYPAEFRYNSELTMPTSTQSHWPTLVRKVKEVLDRAERGSVDLTACRQQLTPFFRGDALYDRLFGTQGT